jgi:two-component system NtrC family sensor kinase
MASSTHCIWCGEPVFDEDDASESLLVCTACLLESDDPVTDCAPGNDSETRVPGRGDGDAPGIRASTTLDHFLTRSMVVPLEKSSQAQATEVAWPEELIGRLDPDTLRWLEVSESLREFLGQARTRLLAQTFPQFLHPDDRALATDELQRACEVGERNDVVLRLKGRSNAWHYVRLSAQARYEQDGKINHIRCNLRDVTDRVQAEQELERRTEQLVWANEQLREANLQLKEAQAQLVHSEKLAALGTLTAGLAHEMNNPLAFAINNLSLIERDLDPLFRLLALEREGEPEIAKNRPELAAAIATLADEVDLAFLEDSLPRLIQSTYKGLVRVGRIVERLRSFAQLDRAKVSELNIDESIDDCLIMLSEDLSRTGIEIDRRREPLPAVEASSGDMNQVFLNLLANAVDAIESTGTTNGRIVVESRRIADQIFVEITDNGCGIEPEILSKIFIPFFTTKPQGKGIGLGLSFCHGIVAHHRGRIEVESQPGQGTCIRVSLPIHSEFHHPRRDRPPAFSVDRNHASAVQSEPAPA